MEDNRLIVIFSGGRSCGRVACIGLFLPGDVKRLEQYISYMKFEEAMYNVGQAMSTAYETVSQQLKEMMAQFEEGMRSVFNEQYPSLHDLLQAMSEGINSNMIDPKKYYNGDPLPKPPKIIPAFKVYEAYKGRLNYKPVYYHCRNNC
jgi:hypothetical protein